MRTQLSRGPVPQQAVPGRAGWRRRTGKLAAVAVTGAALCLAAAACSSGGSGTSSSGKTVVTVAYGSTYVFDTAALTAKFWNNLKTEFDAQNPDATLQLVPIPGSYNDIVNKLTLLYRQGSSAPDVAEIPTAQIGLYAQSGYLKPLNSYLSTASWWSHFPAVVQSEGRFGGKVYAVNHGENTSLLYYNSQLLARAGIPGTWQPKTWADILTAARAVKAHVPGVIPLWLAAGTGSGTNGILQGGGNLIDGSVSPKIYDATTGKWVVNSPGLRAVLGFYQQVYSGGLGAPTSDLFSPSAVTAPLTLFKQGKLAIAVGSNYYGGAWSPLVCGPCWPGATKVMRTAPIPTQNGQAPGTASTLGGWDMAMSATTPHPGLAWKVINLLESEKFIVDAANWAGWVPPNTQYATSPAYANFAAPYQVAAAKVLPFATLTPSQAAYTEWGHSFNVATGALAAGNVSVPAALSQMNSDATSLLGPSKLESNG